MKFKKSAYFEALAKEFPKRMKNIDPMSFAWIAWGFSEVEEYDRSLFDLIAEETLRRRPENFTPTSIAMLAKAMKRAKVDAPKLMERIADDAVRRMESFYAENLALLAFAFSDVDDIELKDAIADQTLRSLTHFSVPN